MLTLDDEDDVLDDVEDAVAIALDRLELHEEGYVDDIKLNKLAYFLIQEEHLNITYGWYKYGPAPYDVDDYVRGKTTYVDPHSPNEIRASGSSRLPRENEKYKSPEAWARYFSEEIRDQFIDVVTSDTKEYLVRFYDEYAPEEYRDLYKASVHLQKILDTIKEDKTWVSRSDEIYSETKDRGFDLYHEMLEVEQMDEAVDPYYAYLQLLQDTVIGVQEQARLSESQFDEVVNVVNFFYSAAWEWPALLISWRTIRGDNKRILQRSVDKNLNDHRDGYYRELESLRSKVKNRGLLPEHVEEMEDLEESEQVLPPRTPEEDLVKGWTSLGMRTILNDGSK